MPISLPKMKTENGTIIMNMLLAKIKKRNHRKTVKVSIILAGIKCSSADIVQLSGTRESVDAENI